jgi:hypothetical protein
MAIERIQAFRAFCKECGWRGPVRTGLRGRDVAADDMDDHNEDDHNEEIAQVKLVRE